MASARQSNPQSHTTTARLLQEFSSNAPVDRHRYGAQQLANRYSVTPN
jgi:hypothetical protein